MPRPDRASLRDEPDELARLVRILDASVNVEILRALAQARRRGDGWLYLSQIAERIGQAPGTVGAAIEKLSPLLEEKRERGLRYFRTRFVDVTITLERPPRGADAR
jgi:DNA-binding transcriptional ArsR family regulator